MNTNLVPDKKTAFKKDYVIKEYNRLTEDKDKGILTVDCEDMQGRVVVHLVMKNKKLVEASATADAQDSKLYEDVAKKYGISKDDLIYTQVGNSVAKAGMASHKDEKKDKNKVEALKKAEHPMDAGKPDMSKQHMAAISHHLQELASMGFGDQDVPDWVESKMSRASSDISDIAHFFDGEQNDMNKSSDGLPCEHKGLELLRKFSQRKLQKGDVIQFKPKAPKSPEEQAAAPAPSAGKVIKMSSAKKQAPAAPEALSAEHSERLDRIRNSLLKINSLMAELKKQTKPKSEE